MAAFRHRRDIPHHLNPFLYPMTLPIRLLYSQQLKKPTHSRRKSNDRIEHSILTFSRKFDLLKRESEASW
jgi:hypothetical protein